VTRHEALELFLGHQGFLQLLRQELLQHVQRNRMCSSVTPTTTDDVFLLRPLLNASSIPTRSTLNACPHNF
jgi:hypothetical protein